MRSTRYILAVLSTAAILAICWYAYTLLFVDPFEGKEEYAAYVTEGLRTLKVLEPGWEVMVLAAARDSELPREKIWDIWGKLEEWPTWSVRMHRNCTWFGDREWGLGHRFHQTVRLSWPEEEFTSLERVVQVFVPDRVAYVREGGPFQSYQVWRFLPLPGGGTRIISVQVLHGSDVGFLRPLVEKKWQKLHEQMVNGLMRYLQNAK
jgi:hypothetical protein